MEKAIADATVAAFCKINEQRHLFMRLRYVKENGLPGFYSPDFLVRTPADCWLVETKAQNQIVHPDVIRKQTAAAWCKCLNELPQEARGGLSWHYCLLGEAVCGDFARKGATMEEILGYSRIQEKTGALRMLF